MEGGKKGESLGQGATKQLVCLWETKAGVEVKGRVEGPKHWAANHLRF